MVPSGELETRAVASAAGLDDPVLRKLYDYWDGKRGDRPFPRRADIDPVDIPALLPHLILVDVVPEPPDFVFRVAGTLVTEATGMELTGKRLRLLPLSPIGAIVAEFSRVIDSAEPRYSAGPLSNPLDRYNRVERLLLPLARDSEKVEQILGAVIFHNTPGQSS